MSTNEQPTFEVRLRSRRVQRDLDSLQEVAYQRVASRLRALANEPRPQGCEKLYDDIYRVRVGDIRKSILLTKETSVLKWEESAAGVRKLTRELKACSGEQLPIINISMPKQSASSGSQAPVRKLLPQNRIPAMQTPCRDCIFQLCGFLHPSDMQAGDLERIYMLWVGNPTRAQIASRSANSGTAVPREYT